MLFLHHQRRCPEYVPSRIADPNYVRIFDTTLRDGEQSPSATLTSKEKLNIARQLVKLEVDIIEAGIDEDGYVLVICGLSRCNERDIKIAWEAVKYAKRPRVHMFIATSEIHMEYKLRKTKQEVIEIARSMVKFAHSLGCQDVSSSVPRMLAG
ncbi:hypothetical protein ACOSP7_006086 [Xanthoceras sorbifolium]